MKPIAVNPTLPVEGSSVNFADDQPEYQTLPAWRLPSGEVVTRWRLSWRERLAAFLGRDLYLSLLTFNQPLQPLLPTFSENDTFGFEVGQVAE